MATYREMPVEGLRCLVGTPAPFPSVSNIKRWESCVVIIDDEGNHNATRVTIKQEKKPSDLELRDAASPFAMRVKSPPLPEPKTEYNLDEINEIMVKKGYIAEGADFTDMEELDKAGEKSAYQEFLNKLKSLVGIK